MKKKTIQRMKSVLWFLVKLNLLAIPLYLINYFGLSLPQFQDLWAAILSGSLSLSGYESMVDGNIIGVKAGTLIQQINFSWDSTGWKSLYALTILVFASGLGSLRHKLRFLAWGLPLVFFANFLRVFTTIVFSLKFGFDYFELVHGVLWSTIMVVFVLAFWYFAFLRERGSKR